MDIKERNSEKANRAHNTAMHEENIFHSTLNFFLVAESMLLLFYSTITANLPLAANKIIALFGLILTAFWIIINDRQRYHLHTALILTKRHCSEYNELKSIRKKGKKYDKCSSWILAYCIPGIVLLIWLTLLFAYLF